MNIQTLLKDEMEKLRHRNPGVHALLEKIFQHKDGKGDYSVERHKWMETLDKETFLNEIRRIESIQEQKKKNKSGSPIKTIAMRSLTRRRSENTSALPFGRVNKSKVVFYRN